MSGWHRPTDTSAGGDRYCGRWTECLLSSNIIHICVRVVMLVRMIHTCLFAAVRVKSCPSMHSSCVIASLAGCACTVGRPPISGVAQKLIKRNYWPFNRECKSRLGIKGGGP